MKEYTIEEATEIIEQEWKREITHIIKEGKTFLFNLMGDIDSYTFRAGDYARSINEKELQEIDFNLKYCNEVEY